MQFIGTGDRILTENFNVGYLYTITFKTGIYINSACIGIGDSFVMFQRAEPDLLFNLNVDTADEVDTIELYDSGGGTNNYEELTNKPKINSVELIGNKSLSDLGIQAEITDENPISSALVSGLGTAAAADTTDFATAAQGALAASAVQPSDLTTALATKQDALSAAQLNAVNSGITSTDVAQITTNKNNISSLTPTTTTTDYTATAAETWEKTALSIPVAGKKAVFFSGNIMYNNAEPLGVGIGIGNTFTSTAIVAIEESAAGTLRGALSCVGMYYNNSSSPQTLDLWVKYRTTQRNMITLMYRQL